MHFARFVYIFLSFIRLFCSFSQTHLVFVAVAVIAADEAIVLISNFICFVLQLLFVWFQFKIHLRNVSSFSHFFSLAVALLIN